MKNSCMVNRYRNKAKHFQNKYNPFLDEFSKHDDDRMLVVNMAKQVIEACKAMEGMDSVFVRVAFNKAFNEQNELMENIVTRFTGKVWNGWTWLDAENAE